MLSHPPCHRGSVRARLVVCSPRPMQFPPVKRSAVVEGIMPVLRERCVKCILPNAPMFALDAHGTCALCNEGAAGPRAKRDEHPLAVELEERIQEVRARGEGRRFDCVVGLSGGRDSTYLLYLLTRKHGLRCLAAYYRTPFTSSVTDANVRRVVGEVGATLKEIDLSPEKHRRFARELVLLWERRPDPIIGNMMCAPCKLVNREVFRIARLNGVRTVICGANPYEAVQIAAGVAKNAGVYTSAHLELPRQLERTLALVKNGTVALGRNRELLRYLRLGIQASLMYINPHTPYLRLRFSDIVAMEYFYHHPWVQADCEAALAKIGWVLPPGCNSTWKSDCSFAEVKNIVFKKMTGISYLDALLSNMVRAGAIERGEALRRLETEGRPSPQRLEEVCRTLRVPQRTFA